MMTPVQVMEELEAMHEFVCEVIQEAEDDHRLHELRFGDVSGKHDESSGSLLLLSKHA